MPAGCLQHLWNGWRSSARALLSGHVLPLGKLHRKFCLNVASACSPINIFFILMFKGTLTPQGAVVGLIAGLAMAFWVGIGSFVMRMASSTDIPLLNTTIPSLFENTTMTSLLSALTAKPR